MMNMSSLSIVTRLALFLALIGVVVMSQRSQQSPPPHHRHQNFYAPPASSRYAQQAASSQSRAYSPNTPPSPSRNNSSAAAYFYQHQQRLPPTTTTPRPPSAINSAALYNNQHQYRARSSSLTSDSSSTCNVPSDFWCDSWELAQKCGVTQQCENFKRSTEPISITLMYEALCPFCQRFISQHLGNLLDQYGSRVTIDLVPFGNSRMQRNGEISCNHGPAECDANRLMSCVIDVVKVRHAVPFIVCFERQLATYPQVEQALHWCMTFIRDAYRQIRQCYDGPRGRELQQLAARRTMGARSHPINEVPYLLINNYSPSSHLNGINLGNLPSLLQKWTSQKSG